MGASRQQCGSVEGQGQVHSQLSRGLNKNQPDLGPGSGPWQLAALPVLRAREPELKEM